MHVNRWRRLAPFLFYFLTISLPCFYSRRKLRGRAEAVAEVVEVGEGVAAAEVRVQLHSTHPSSTHLTDVARFFAGGGGGGGGGSGSSRRRARPGEKALKEIRQCVKCLPTPMFPSLIFWTAPSFSENLWRDSNVPARGYRKHTF